MGPRCLRFDPYVLQLSFAVLLGREIAVRRQQAYHLLPWRDGAPAVHRVLAGHLEVHRKRHIAMLAWQIAAVFPWFDPKSSALTSSSQACSGYPSKALDMFIPCLLAWNE